MIETKIQLALLVHTLVILALILTFEPIFGLALYGAWRTGLHIFYTIKMMIHNHTGE